MGQPEKQDVACGCAFNIEFVEARFDTPPLGMDTAPMPRWLENPRCIDKIELRVLGAEAQQFSTGIPGCTDYPDIKHGRISIQNAV